MKMRLLMAVSALFLLSSVSNAQNAHFRAGLNLANVSVNENGRVDDANQLSSFQVGVMSDFALGTNMLSLQSGLLFTGKGSKVQNGTTGQIGYFKQTVNPMYLEVPVNLLVKAPLGSTARFFVGGGPYLGIGIAGKTKTEGTSLTGNYSYERDITFSNDDPTTLEEEEGTGFNVVKRFDYGLNGTAGIEGKSLVLGVNYGLGLAKLQSGANSSADHNNKHRVLSFTLGFKF